MTVITKECIPDHFEWYNSPQFSFTNLWGLPSNSVGCESFHERSSPASSPSVRLVLKDQRLQD